MAKPANTHSIITKTARIHASYETSEEFVYVESLHTLACDVLIFVDAQISKRRRNLLQNTTLHTTTRLSVCLVHGTKSRTRRSRKPDIEGYPRHV